MSEFIVVYPLGIFPASWDFLNWLIITKIIQERWRPDDKLLVKFVRYPWSDDIYWAQPLDQRELLFENVMRPALRLIGAEETNRLPNAITPPWPIRLVVEACRAGETVPRWKVPDDIMQEALEYLDGTRPIVITLREAAHTPERNSRLDDWMRFADMYQDVLFIRDSAKAAEPLDGYRTCPRASTDLLFRTAIMAQAHANLMTSNGPICVAYYLDTPWLMFNPMPNLPGYSAGTPEFWNDFMGIGVGGQLPWATDKQRYVWGGAMLEDIIAAWERLGL